MITRALGIVLGVAADAVLGDPARHHPVAWFGTFASRVERSLYADDRARGAAFAAATVAPIVAAGVAAERATRRHPVTHVAATALATWAVLGARSLAREGRVMADRLDDGDLDGARARLGHLCGRDPAGLHAPELARSTAPSTAEDTADDTADETVDEIVAGDVGVTAWNSCAGGLPWGQPLDQRPDNARSITYDWPHTDELIMLANSEVTLQVRSSAPVGHVSVKLCDVAPDGTSTLITRGMLDLAQRGVWPSDPFGRPGAAEQPVVPGEWMDLRLQFEATTWTLVPGHRLRLAIAGTDWPNCWPPSQPFTLSVRRDSVQLTLRTTPALPAARDAFEAGSGPNDESEGVVWTYETDVLARETRVHTRYGGTYGGTHGTTVTDVYEGSLGISTVDLSNAWAKGRSRYDLSFVQPDGTTTVCSTEARLHVRSDREWFHVDLTLQAWRDGALFGEHTWAERFAR